MRANCHRFGRVYFFARNLTKPSVCMQHPSIGVGFVARPLLNAFLPCDYGKRLNHAGRKFDLILAHRDDLATIMVSEQPA